MVSAGFCADKKIAGVSGQRSLDVVVERRGPKLRVKMMGMAL
jgi:hypothetical protein